MPIRINVVMGGPSAEHDISLLSAMDVLTHLDRKRYGVRAVVVTMDLEFYYCDIDDVVPQTEEFLSPDKYKSFSGPFKPYSSAPVWENCDVAFLAIHGAFGEDGLLQGFLDSNLIPYTGSGVYSSATGMNKIASKILFEQNGIKTPPYYITGNTHPEITWQFLAERFDYPMFVKCPHSGSSRLMTRVDCGAGLGTKITEYVQYSPDVLVEKGIKGSEFAVSVLEMPDGTVAVLPPVKINLVKTNYFSHSAKFGSNGAEKIVPCSIDAVLSEKINALALKCHRILGCRGASTSDIIVDTDNVPYVLEINTLPKMTVDSLLPLSFKATGGTYEELLDILISVACKNPVSP